MARRYFPSFTMPMTMSPARSNRPRRPGVLATMSGCTRRVYRSDCSSVMPLQNRLHSQSAAISSSARPLPASPTATCHAGVRVILSGACTTRPSLDRMSSSSDTSWPYGPWPRGPKPDSMSHSPASFAKTYSIFWMAAWPCTSSPQASASSSMRRRILSLHGRVVCAKADAISDILRAGNGAPRALPGTSPCPCMGASRRVLNGCHCAVATHWHGIARWQCRNPVQRSCGLPHPVHAALDMGPAAPFIAAGAYRDPDADAAPLAPRTACLGPTTCGNTCR